jgi:60 kDa SS-A/Ro ribonucleoprotein
MRHVGEWYDRDPEKLAMQVTKYAQRNGWSHRDVLRLCHFKTEDSALNNVLKYVAQHEQWLEAESIGDADEFLAAVDEAKDESTSESRVVDLISDYGLVREHLATQHLNRVPIWEALLQKMPLTAMIRNLGKMTSIGLTVPLSNAATKVCAALSDREALKAQRVHPVTLLFALKTYSLGHGIQGKLSWNPTAQILASLDEAFYDAFDLVEPTGQNFFLGVDCSGSMRCPILSGVDKKTGRPTYGVISCCEAAAVMAMLAARTEPNTHVMGFTTSMQELCITRRDSLLDASNKAQLHNWGGTDCARPMRYAREHNLDVDVFCVYTDNETWAGPRHVCQELDAYRQKTGKPAKLAVFGLSQTDFTIADPGDPGQMDFVGFDTAAPALLADFARS